MVLWFHRKCHRQRYDRYNWADQWRNISFGPEDHRFSFGTIERGICDFPLSCCGRCDEVRSLGAQLSNIWKYIFFIFRFQNNYTEAEVEFFRLILKELATADGHSIDSIYALNMIGQVKVKHIGTKSFTKKRAQKIIAGWIRVGYLVEIGDRFWLGPKGIVEFGPFLRIHYADNVSECVLCKEPIFSVSFFFNIV